MQKILNQEEIDALFKRARGGKPTGEGAGARVITPCDFRSAGQITKEQLRLLTALHETFARNLSHALGAYLRIGLEMAVVSVEQLTYAIRKLTEIEEEIFASVVAMIVRELSSSWKTLGLGFTFEGRLVQAEVSELNSPTERVLSISFELRTPEVQAVLNIVFPSALSALMQRSLQKSGRRHSSAVATEHLRNRMMQSEFQLELSLPAVAVPAKELLALQAGSVLKLPHKVQEPVAMTVAGTRLFHAYPVSKNHKRAGYIQKLAPIHNQDSRGQNGFE